MTQKDMESVLADFVAATEMANEAGFDLLELHIGARISAVELHLAAIRICGRDEYGGSLKNRMRFPLEGVCGGCVACPDEQPISVRVSAR